MLCSQVMEYTAITDIRQIQMFMNSKKGTGKYNRNVVIFKAEMLGTDINNDRLTAFDPGQPG